MPSAASIRQTFVVIEAALSFVGAGIAGALWWADRTRQDLPCTSDGHGCELVAASRWSHVDLIFWHDVPVALLGLLGYLSLLAISMLRLASESETNITRLHRLLWLITAGGAAYSWYLQWIAHYKIGAFCIYCRSSAIVMTLLFLTATVEWWLLRRQIGRDSSDNG